MIKGLDDDEVEFLDLVDRTKMEEEKRKWEEEKKEMQDFRAAVASLNEQSLQERIKTEVKRMEMKKPSGNTELPIGMKKNSQLKLLAGAVKKRPAEATNGSAEKKPKLDGAGESRVQFLHCHSRASTLKFRPFVVFTGSYFIFTGAIFRGSVGTSMQKSFDAYRCNIFPKFTEILCNLQMCRSLLCVTSMNED